MTSLTLRVERVIKGLIDLFIPYRIVSAHIASFTATGKPTYWPGIVVYFASPILSAAISLWFGWDFLRPIVSELLTAVALIGSVLIAISAVLVQGVFNEAAAPGFATKLDRRRVSALRNVHGTIAYGALTSFVLAGALVVLLANTEPAPLATGGLVLHAVTFGLLVHVSMTLLRVMIVADLVVAAYSRKAKNRAAA